MSTAARKLFHQLSVSCKDCSLGSLCVPHGLDQPDIDKLDESVGHTKLLHSGDYLYRQNTPFKSLYALKSGSVKIVTNDPNVGESILGVYLPGEIIGFDGVSSEVYQCSIQALETSNICEINLDTLQADIPNIYKQLLKHASKAINHTQTAGSVNKANAKNRVVSFLLDIAERYQARGYFHTEFDLYLSRGELGNLLNLTPETISRNIRQLEREKYITLKNNRRVVLNNIEGLKKLNCSPP